MIYYHNKWWQVKIMNDKKENVMDIVTNPRRF